jgi:hypothetical protein
MEIRSRITARAHWSNSVAMCMRSRGGVKQRKSQSTQRKRDRYVFIGHLSGKSREKSDGCGKGPDGRTVKFPVHCRGVESNHTKRIKGGCDED